MSGETEGDARLVWNPPGDVAWRFMHSSSYIQTLQGPLGGGKTSTVVVKAQKLAAEQAPSTVDGWRKFKLCVVHQDYRRLWDNVIPSWLEWVPKDGPGRHWVGSEDNPATHIVKQQLPDGSKMEFIADFVAIGDHRAEDILRGYQPTAFWLTEADLLAEDVFQYAVTRAGRYPRKIEGGASWYGILMDFNAPVFDSWLHKLIVGEHDFEPGIFEYFKQPAAAFYRGPGDYELNPDAENLDNLDKDYYRLQLQILREDIIRRMICNEVGYSRDGLPVFPEFSDRVHVASRELEADPRLKLIIGVDGGLSPAAILRQNLPNGQRRIVDEVVCEHGVGPKRFAQRLNQLLGSHYAAWEKKDIAGWADPATQYGADTKAGERSWLEIVRKETGIDFRPAPGGNKLTPRLEGIRQTLVTFIDGETPMYLMSPRCKVLRKAYNAGYRYRQVRNQTTMGDRYVEEPEKNEYSHPADADQYAELGSGGYYEVMGRRAASTNAVRQTQAITEDNPTGAWGHPRRPLQADLGD